MRPPAWAMTETNSGISTDARTFGSANFSARSLALIEVLPKAKIEESMNPGSSVMPPRKASTVGGLSHASIGLPRAAMMFASIAPKTMRPLARSRVQRATKAGKSLPRWLAWRFRSLLGACQATTSNSIPSTTKVATIGRR